MLTQEQAGVLQVTAAILIRCFLITAAVMIVWFGIFLLLGDWIYCMHSRWFEFSRNDFDMVYYYGMGFVKMCGVVFFLIPYISIRVMLRKK